MLHPSAGGTVLSGWTVRPLAGRFCSPLQPTPPCHRPSVGRSAAGLPPTQAVVAPASHSPAGCLSSTRAVAPPTNHSATASDADTIRDFDGKFSANRRSLVPEPASEVLEVLTKEEQDVVRLFQTNSRSVVGISTSSTVFVPFSFDGLEVPRGFGSGFIWDQAGHVVTNAHVIAGASTVRVALYDGTSYLATVIGKDAESDLAVLRVKMPPVKAQQQRPVVLGSSSNLLVGQKVYAIGFPFGLDQTLTSGLVSGLGRELSTPSANGVPLSNLVQTDAAINPGNSGGVLLDSRGRLCGINTAIIDPSGRGVNSGVGFAIPIDGATGLVNQIIQLGRVVRPALGISLAPPAVLARLAPQVKGVLVMSVASKGPAEAAGMRGTVQQGGMIMASRERLGDIITSLDGRPVTKIPELFAALDACKPGQVVDVTVLRDGKEVRLRVKLTERSSRT